jgi:hypothetical protein
MGRMSIALQLYAKLLGATGVGRVSVKSQQKIIQRLQEISNDLNTEKRLCPVPTGWPLHRTCRVRNAMQSVHTERLNRTLLGCSWLAGTSGQFTICDRKIYETSDQYIQRQQQRLGFHQLANYKSMNPDEMIFLEAACALSRVGSDIRHVLDTKFEQSRLPRLKRPCSMRSNSSRIQVYNVGPLKTIESCYQD